MFLPQASPVLRCHEQVWSRCWDFRGDRGSSLTSVNGCCQRAFLYPAGAGQGCDCELGRKTGPHLWAASEPGALSLTGLAGDNAVSRRGTRRRQRLSHFTAQVCILAQRPQKFHATESDSVEQTGCSQQEVGPQCPQRER